MISTLVLRQAIPIPWQELLFLPVKQTPYAPIPKVFAWGNGRNGRLGLGDIRDRPSACHVEAIKGVKIEAVFCGVSHSMAVCSTGACYAWGKNNFGQCGESDPAGSDIVSVCRILWLWYRQE